MDSSPESLAQEFLSKFAEYLGSLRTNRLLNDDWVNKYEYQKKHFLHSLICGTITRVAGEMGYAPLVELGWRRPSSEKAFLSTRKIRQIGSEFKPDISLLNISSKEIEAIVEYESLNSSDERIVERCIKPESDKPKFKDLVNAAYYAIINRSVYKNEPFKRPPRFLLLIVTLPDTIVDDHKTTCLKKTELIKKHEWSKIFLENDSKQLKKYNYLLYFRDEIKLPNDTEISFCFLVINGSRIIGWLKAQNKIQPLTESYR